MLTRRLVCPGCGVGLKVATTLPVGKKINCPKCEESFRVPGEDEDDPPAPRAAKPRKAARPVEDDDIEEVEAVRAKGPRRPARDEDDEEDDDRPRRPKRRGAAKQSSSLPLILGLGLGGLVLVGGVVAAVFLWPEKKPDPKVATGLPPGQKEKEKEAPKGGDKGKGDDKENALARGLQIYEQNNCARCHSTGSGGRPGGKGRSVPLAGVGSKHDQQYLKDHVRNAKSHVATSRMPRYGEATIPDKDLGALVDYLASLK